MLNYLGPNVGPAPVSAALTGGAPGSMPAGIPGAPPVNPISPVPRLNLPSPGQSAAIAPAGPGGPPPPPAPQDPSDIQYDTLTQQDGTVVLFLKNPDGSRGPAVKIIKAPKIAGPPQ